MNKVTDFRIGNLVLQEGNITVIDSLERNINDWERTNHKRTNDIKSIPISIEWLLNFGFEFEDIGDDTTVEQETYRKATINYDGIAFDIEFNVAWQTFTLDFITGNLIEYRYVHQLQNLFYYLTSQELKLKK